MPVTYLDSLMHEGVQHVGRLTLALQQAEPDFDKVKQILGSDLNPIEGRDRETTRMTNPRCLTQGAASQKLFATSDVLTQGILALKSLAPPPVLDEPSLERERARVARDELGTISREMELIKTGEGQEIGGLIRGAEPRHIGAHLVAGGPGEGRGTE